MSTYAEWLHAGSPITPAQPIADLVAALKHAYPKGASQFSWYANAAHYQANPPQDHTPYSADAWPLPDPRWWVFATDVMVTAVGGVDEAQRLFDYWLAEAKTGHAPWIKYLIWKATIYDVRRSWVPHSNSGHFDHIHISARTDHQHTHLGSWPAIPGDDMALTSDDAHLLASTLLSTVLGHSGPTVGVALQTGIAAAAAEGTVTRAEFAALAAKVDQVLAAVVAGGGSVDTAAILAGVDERLATLRAGVEADTRDAVARRGRRRRCRRTGLTDPDGGPDVRSAAATAPPMSGACGPGRWVPAWTDTTTG